jgi:hypothetical protein
MPEANSGKTLDVLVVDAKVGEKSWRLDMEVGHGGWTWRLDMEVGHGGWTWRLVMEVGHGGWSWRLVMEVGHGGWSWRLKEVEGQRRLKDMKTEEGWTRTLGEGC